MIIADLYTVNYLFVFVCVCVFLRLLLVFYIFCCVLLLLQRIHFLLLLWLCREKRNKIVERGRERES